MRAGILALLLVALNVGMPSAAADGVVSADPRLDAMYQLALREMKLNSVSQIRDWGYNDNNPIPCDCFETGEKWNYVWTRDLSYAADLALARHDPQRVRNSLLFKASPARSGPFKGDTLIAQDTGSGGSWPISTDRVVWFLAARHVLGAQGAFDKIYREALINTVEQDLEYVFDPAMGLYRGETSFLDWREQTYPQWTRDDVTFIGESFSLSTNVLHYLALKQAAEVGPGNSWRSYADRAASLKKRIEQVFWDPQRQTLRSVVGPAYAPIPLASYDLLGISLAIEAGIVSGERARLALKNYPVAPLGSPVVWPQQREVPIYHNRAMWPFVSAYALRAARRTRDVNRITFEINSILDAAAQSGSNMENYEIRTRKPHVDDGDLSGPVVNSPRQLWSVGGMLMAIEEGIFGLRNDGHVDPRLPADLGSRVFGKTRRIALRTGDRTIELLRPTGKGNLWIAQRMVRRGKTTTVQLKAVQVAPTALNRNGLAYAPLAPVSAVAKGVQLYVNGARASTLAVNGNLQCTSATVTVDGIESLPSRPGCLPVRVMPSNGMRLEPGRYRLVRRYSNSNGPINTGITSAVALGAFRCAGSPPQEFAIAMPHSVREQASTSAIVTVKRSAHCTVEWMPGTNMSDLELNASYTGGKGGNAPLNEAELGNVLISRLDSATMPKNK